jgi:16S rRNA (guanine966-N2)-methyltransferase
MRVIAGSLKGRRLKTPRWEGLRPTSDKVRETLFNILSPRIGGAHVLDGFAGAGALGLEALSRGAAHVTFVDWDRRAVALVKENLALCGVRGGYTIHRDDLVRALRHLAPEEYFDVALLDPPYGASDVTAALDATAMRLAQNGVLVLEHATRCNPAVPPILVRTRDVKSGDSTLTFFVRKDSA